MCDHRIYSRLDVTQVHIFDLVKRYETRNIQITCGKGNTEKSDNMIAKNTQCKNNIIFSVINHSCNSNNLAGSISARVNIIIMIGSG